MLAAREVAPLGHRCGNRLGTGLAQAPVVTLRISILAAQPTLRIRVEGRLSIDEVGELEQLVGKPGATCLELAELRSADAAGLATLRRLRAEGIAMTGLSPHLAWRIEADGD